MNNVNGLWKQILPVEDLIKVGQQVDDLPTAEAYGRSVVKALRTDPFDPTKYREDQLKEQGHQKDLKELQDAEISAAHAATGLKEAERRVAILQTGLAEPKLPSKITAAGIAALTVSISPTIYDQFLRPLPDRLAGWVLAIVAGVMIGAFVVWSLTGMLDPSGRRSGYNLAGLIGGAGIALFTFFLRLAAGDILTAVALTALEIATLLIVESFARPLRDRFRDYAACQEAQNKEASTVKALRGERAFAVQRVTELQHRLAEHHEYISVRSLCAQKPGELVEAALSIVRYAHQQRKTENEKRRLGLL